MLRLGLILTILAVTACGSETPTLSEGGTLAGSITFGGLAAGSPLAIAVYRSFPPSGPPVASKLVERYELPFAYRFEGLAPGTYYIGALLDRDRMDTRHAGMLNSALDPHGYAGGGAPIQVTPLEGATGADIELEEGR